MNSPDNCGTIGMSAMPDLGYTDPVGAILRGEKTHTLRKRRVSEKNPYREVIVGGHRTGVILKITGCSVMTSEEYLTDQFAQADGLRDANALAECLHRFYGRPVPATMWRLDFEVVRAPKHLVANANGGDQEAMEL